MDVDRLIDMLQALEKFVAVKEFGDGSAFKVLRIFNSQENNRLIVTSDSGRWKARRRFRGQRRRRSGHQASCLNRIVIVTLTAAATIQF